MVKPMVRSWLTDGVVVCSGEEAVPAKKTKTVISASEISQTRQTRVEKVGGLDLVKVAPENSPGDFLKLLF